MALLTDVLTWLRELPAPAMYAATGGLVLAECTVGLGFIAPGEGGLLLASAVLVTSFPKGLLLWLIVTVCAGVGDSIGYAIGRRFGPALRETKLIQKYGVDGWDKATGILRKRGAWAVFFARFLPVVRTLTPAAAGTSQLPYRKFLPAVLAGAACWAALHITLGAALGEAAERVEGAMGVGGAVIIGAIVVALAAMIVVHKRRKARSAAIPVVVIPVEPTVVAQEPALELEG
ncbi:DedA family protein [Actinophytocola sp.]|uniref:DedA family protein n=1 Tax=Actinophytocola sp. TaxID=1872138 RepID=UPI00389A6157